MGEVIYEQAKDTASKIRKALKKAFPELGARHFSVKSKTYTGGSSITVSWEDYPIGREVENIIKQYKSATFDGMRDMEESHGYIDPEDGKRYAGAKYIFTDYKVSDERREKVIDYMEKVFADFDRKDLGSYRWYRDYNKVLTYFDKDNQLLPEYDYVAYQDQVESNKGKKLDVNGIVEERVKKALKTEAVELFGFTSEEAKVIGDITRVNGNEHRFKSVNKSIEKQLIKRIQSKEDIEKMFLGARKYAIHQKDFDERIDGYIIRFMIDEFRGLIRKIRAEKKNKENKENKVVDFNEAKKEKQIIGEVEKRDDNKGKKAPNLKVDKKWKLTKSRKEIYKVDELKDGSKGLIVFKYSTGELGIYNGITRTQFNAIGKKKQREYVTVFTKDVNKYVDVFEYLTDKTASELDKIVTEFVGDKKGSKEERSEEVVESKWKLNNSTKVYFKHTKLKDGTQGYIEFNTKKGDISVYNSFTTDNRLLSIVPTEDELGSLYKVLNKSDVLVLESLSKYNKGDKTRGDVKKDKGSEKVEYKNRVILAEEVMKHLLKGEVQLVFIKADGSERHMRATRNINLFREDAMLVENYNQLNTGAEIGKEINNGTISVVDLDVAGGSGARKFVVERLISFQPKGQKLREVKVEDTKKEEHNHFDPTKKLDTAKMIKVLSKKVVRLVFKKKDGSLRPMVATRNNEIVGLYANLTRRGMRQENRAKNTEDAIKAQIEKDYVTVLDLEKGEFRTFKPSTLESYDSDLDISSWIEFTPNNDAWFDIAKNGKNPKEFYQEGKRGGKNIGRSLTERTRYEQKRKMELWEAEASAETLRKASEQASKSKKEVEYKRKRRHSIKVLVHKEVKRTKDTPKTKEFLNLYNDMKYIAEELEEDKAFNNMENTITQVKHFDNMNLVAIQISGDVLYIHPTFIVNAYSGRVFVDRTPERIFKDIGKEFSSDADWGSEDVLEKYVSQIKAINRGKEVVVEDKKDVVRMNRLFALAEQRKEQYKKENISLRKMNLKGKGGLLLFTCQEGTYLLTTTMLIKQEGKKGIVVFKVKDKNAVLSEYEEYFNKWIRQTKVRHVQDQLYYISKLVKDAFDLRKTVKEVK